MLGLLTSRFTAAKEDTPNGSKHWFLECSNFGQKRSYWALVGLRDQAQSSA